MDDSILISVKTMLGLMDDYNAFDGELILHINSVMTILYQLGVGRQDKIFVIDGEQTKWSDFFGDSDVIPLVKSYTYLKVRLLFDPPNSGVLHEAMERQVEEVECRLNIQAETPEYGVIVEDDWEGDDEYELEWDAYHYL